MSQKKGWVLITGSSKRVGKQIALTLANEGYSTIIHYNRSKELAEETVRECQKWSPSECIQGDFSTLDSVQEFGNRYLERFPETSVLINNVGNFLIKSLEDTTMREWHDLFMTNLNAPFLLSKILTPSLKLYRGNIINIGTSGLQSIKAYKEAPAYTLTKLSLYGLTKSLAKELANDHVRVNMVSPGILNIAVDLHDHSNIPMGRPGTSQEIANVVAFLLKEENNYITGQNIEVAGAFGL